MNKILSKDKMEIIGNRGERLWLFNPTLFRLFPVSGNMHEMNFKQKIRFFLLLRHGYRVYVLADCEDNVLGCAMFANGGSYRYPFASKKDLICGPYYTVPEYRNQGIARLLSDVIDNYESEYDTIWAHIWHTNAASVKCMEKVGFQYAGRLRTKGLLQKCIPDENGGLILVKKTNPKRMKKEK